MRLLFILYISLATATWACAADTEPGQGQGWTGVTNPKDVILAREMLMVELEELMKPIDTYTVDKTVPEATITRNAQTIAAMLQAVPHLFPPTTNLYDPGAEQPVTLALPKIWEEFAAFYAMALATSKTADALAHTAGNDALSKGADDLRESCEACHEVFELPYEPPKPSEEDLNFDFDSIFKKEPGKD